MIPASYEPRRDVLYWDGTVRKLLERLAASDMTYIHHDMPIEEIMPFVAAEDVAGPIAAYLRCERCGRSWRLAAGARSEPDYRPANE